MWNWIKKFVFSEVYYLIKPQNFTTACIAVPVDSIIDGGLKITRIFNGCEVRIENSIMRVTVQFAPNNHYRFFSFNNGMYAWICVILSISHKNNYIFQQEMFGSAPI